MLGNYLNSKIPNLLNTKTLVFNSCVTGESQYNQVTTNYLLKQDEYI